MSDYHPWPVDDLTRSLNSGEHTSIYAVAVERSWIAMRRHFLEADGIPSLLCPCCGATAYLVDVGMDTATGKFVPTGDVYQCDNWTCLVYFVAGDTCEQAKKPEGE